MTETLVSWSSGCVYPFQQQTCLILSLYQYLKKSQESVSYLCISWFLLRLARRHSSRSGHRTTLPVSCRGTDRSSSCAFPGWAAPALLGHRERPCSDHVCAGSFPFAGVAGERKTTYTPETNSCLCFFHSDDDLVPYDMSEDQELRMKAPVYIRDCIEGRRPWAESPPVSYW